MTTKKKSPAARARQDSAVNDSLQNLYTGMGTTRDKSQYTTVRRNAKSTVEDLDTLFAENDLAHNIVAIPAEDMTREWIDLQSTGAEDAGATVELELDNINARGALTEALMWARLYGASIVVVGLDKQRTKVDKSGVSTREPDLSLPAQPGRVLWLTVYDRNDIVDVVVGEDGAVAAYKVTCDNEVEVIHASRVLRFDGDPTPRRLREAAGWGLSVLDRCREPLVNLDTGMASISTSLTEFSQTVLRMNGLTALLAADKGKVAATRLSMLSLMRSTFGMMLLDKDDEYAEVARQYAGVPDILDRLIERVSSSARMPVSLLMGRSPAGLNATGDADLRWWYAHIAAQQQTKLRGPLWHLIEMVALGIGIDVGEASLTLTFCSLWKPTQQETAATHLTQAQADTIYLTTGVLDASEVRAARFGASGYSVETTVDADPSVDAEGADVNPDDLDVNGDPIVAPLGTSVDVAKSALNGAQVASLMGIVQSVASGNIPRDSAVQMIILAFQASEADADRLLGSAGKTFTPKTTVPAP